MNMLNRPFLFVFVLLFSNQLAAQNIFDETNSKKYANYLFQAGEYKLAAEEFERLIFMNSGNDTIQTRMIQSYRRLAEYKIADQKVDLFYPNLKFNLKTTAIEYVIIQIRINNDQQVKFFIDSTILLNKDEKLFLSLSADLMNAQYENAAEQLIDWNNDMPPNILEYSAIIDNYEHIRFKRQFLAGSLSVIVPGLGQTYAGYWKDGIFALLFTTSAAYQSYRGFKKNGIKSPYGWIYGALGCGFYMGNVYGAIKAANKYNFIKNKEISNRVEKVFSTYYP